MTSSTTEWEKITRGCAEIISEAELREKLTKGKPLRIKLGVDPTAPDLHFGHLVVLRKLKDFQDCGHQIIFIIGDSTAAIGDPSGQSETRPSLRSDQVEENSKTYQEQVFRILDRENTEVRFNSRWLNSLGVPGILELARHATVAQMLQRADFKKRFDEDSLISILELMYPLFQGYDSKEVHADLELGGTDQKFNLLMGREIQLDYGQAPQVVMMMPLLEGLEGVRKMSKSYGNYVAFNDPPKEMFGKLMSIPDALMPKYAELLTDLDVPALKAMHPREAKARLARTLTGAFHGIEAADKASAEFDRVFSKKEAPEDVLDFQLPRGPHRLIEILVETRLVPSKKEGQRLLGQGAVEVDGQRVEENETLDLQEPVLIQVGKRRFVRVVPVPKDV
jgi:tyrosyl-tRNA synthetase